MAMIFHLMTRLGRLTWRLIWEPPIPFLIKLILFIVFMLLLIPIWLLFFLLLPLVFLLLLVRSQRMLSKMAEDNESIPASYRVKDEEPAPEPKGYIENHHRD
jgi:hypothetical protein